MLTLSELQAKELISIENGTRLGSLIDLEIDVSNGIITDLILIPKKKTRLTFKDENEVMIPWSSIVTIGKDVILIRYNQH
ncbi:YlmC/YmxH family sporulation protein [Saliterribacillus persicus]|uniref:YlmC/YmxH family sporulation protein n=1 Tax=Saliterribacillus persicus TaxID=930114 RepID=A0A368XS37_9BACI|nr:YlmC/YmxH family sporulation protein [Saliterribacillus persicus]RCW70791.1 YlmC/YmxH family sporulation protein [Saliterribacillus persicus]